MLNQLSEFRRTEEPRDEFVKRKSPRHAGNQRQQQIPKDYNTQRILRPLQSFHGVRESKGTFFKLDLPIDP